MWSGSLNYGILFVPRWRKGSALKITGGRKRQESDCSTGTTIILLHIPGIDRIRARDNYNCSNGLLGRLHGHLLHIDSGMNSSLSLGQANNKQFSVFPHHPGIPRSRVRNMSDDNRLAAMFGLHSG